MISKEEEEEEEKSHSRRRHYGHEAELTMLVAISETKEPRFGIWMTNQDCVQAKGWREVIEHAPYSMFHQDHVITAWVGKELAHIV